MSCKTWVGMRGIILAMEFMLMLMFKLSTVLPWLGT